MNINIRMAEEGDLEELSLLFCDYLSFYKKVPNIHEVKKFIEQRLKNNDSEIFIAEDNLSRRMVGFTQLYPTFSSLSLKRQYILNDLFVMDDYRGKGLANRLLDSVENFSAANDSKGLTLQTETTNLPAQQLYLKRGWKKLETFITYFINLV